MAMMSGFKGGFLRAVMSSQPHKPGQGSKARNLTLTAAAILVLGGMYSWNQKFPPGLYPEWISWGVPVGFGIVGGWIAYRLVHYPIFADFLITTEAEMAKVSWPSKGELKASTIVVLINCALMALFLFLADSFWKWLLSLLNILKIGGLLGGGGPGMFHVPPLPEFADFLPLLFGK